MNVRKDFQSVLSEVQQLEKLQISQDLSIISRSQKSRYTVGFLDMNKTITSSLMKKDINSLQPIKHKSQLKGRIQPSQAAISQSRARIIQNISVDGESQQKLNNLNQTQMMLFRDDNNSTIKVRKRRQFSVYQDQTVQQKIMKVLSRQGRESPPRPPSGNNVPQLPTRRVYMHPISSEDWLLGAGSDPLLKELHFSQLAGNGSTLFGARFNQPKNGQVRLPPLLDQFSHTLACPISTQKYNLAPCARIAQNFSPKAKCLIIDLQSKSIIFNGQKSYGLTNASFTAQVHLLQPVATDREELLYLNDQRNHNLKQKVNAKLQCYNRYQLYIDQEIQESHIASIRQVWVHKILDQVPGSYKDLNDSIMKILVDSMLKEVNSMYLNSMRKSILDYIMMEEEERLRLGIMSSFDKIVIWGEQNSKKVNLSFNFRNIQQLIAQRLLSYTEVSGQILNQWGIQHHIFELFSTPLAGDTVKSLDEFCCLQIDRIHNVKQFIKKEWIPLIYKKYQDYFLKLKNDNIQMTKDELEQYQKHFYSAIATLLSNLLRELVTQEIFKFTSFFKNYVISDDRQIKDLIENQWSLKSDFQNTFLVIVIKQSKHLIDFEQSPQIIKENLLHIFDEIVMTTHGVLRPEEHMIYNLPNNKDNTKKFLGQVQLDDQWLQDCHFQVESIIEHNVNYAYGVIDLYNEYSFLLREMDTLIFFIQSRQQSQEECSSPGLKSEKHQFQRSVFQVKKDEFMREVTRYLLLHDEIYLKLPYFVDIGFIQVDGREMKRILMGICHELIDYMFNQVLEFVVRRANEITKDVSILIESVSVVPDTTKALIELENLIERIRIKENKLLQGDFSEITAWTYLLINQRIKFNQEDFKILFQTSQQIKSLMDRVQVEEERIKQERVKIENDLRQKREAFVNTIDGLKRDIESLEGYESAFMVKDANEQIDKFQENLDDLTLEMSDIHQDEEMLGQYQTEYPRLDQAKKTLKPYEDLWRLVRDFKQNYQTWTRKQAVFRLNPEEIEKATQEMIKTLNVLQMTFKDLQVERDKLSKGKQKMVSTTLIGPSKLIEEAYVEVMEFQRHVPLLSIFCNLGLKERHWEEISRSVGYNVSPDRDLTFKKLIDADSIKYAFQLKEISENANCEYEIESTLSEMKDEITTIKAEQKAWKNTGTFILTWQFIEKIKQILEKQKVKTQALMESPYIKLFWDQMYNWQEWLNFTVNFMDHSVSVQSVWIYQQHLFNNPEITKHLTSEGSKFKLIDSKWRYVMNQIKITPNLLVFTRQAELLLALKECRATQDLIQTGLNIYLEAKTIKLSHTVLQKVNSAKSLGQDLAVFQEIFQDQLQSVHLHQLDYKIITDMMQQQKPQIPRSVSESYLKKEVDQINQTNE